MALNPKWCQSYRVWTKYFRHWIVDFDYPTEEILQTFIFFDFRSLYGPAHFIEDMKVHIIEYLSERRSFLRDMAETAVLHQTPLGFFKRLVVEKSGGHKNQLNLKLNGLTPLVDAIRTLALDQGILETHTLDRLSGLVEKGVLPQSEADDLRDAFNVIMLVRIRHHINVMSQGRGAGQLYQS